MALPTNFKTRPNLEIVQTGNDRVLKFSKMEGFAPRDSAGMTDPGVFEGKNKLHVIYDENSQLWYLKYEQGGLPVPMKQHFTSFGAALQFCKKYFKGRNINVDA